MGPFERLQRAIDFLEDHLPEEMDIDAVAARACYSPFYFQRLFQALTGFSVGEYLRARRLSEAARRLAAPGAPTVLQIALESGYASHEAFTRAFENRFRLPPSRCRAERPALALQPRIDFLSRPLPRIPPAELPVPGVIESPARGIVGLAFGTHLDDERYFRDIPGFYRTFGENEVYARIPQRVRPAFAYGIACRHRGDGAFSFIVGEESLAPQEALPDGLVRFDIPEGRYLRFRLETAPERIPALRRYLYGVWLPNTAYALDGSLEFEVTDVCASALPGRIVQEIFLPVG